MGCPARRAIILFRLLLVANWVGRDTRFTDAPPGKVQREAGLTVHKETNVRAAGIYTRRIPRLYGKIGTTS
jgi:hypothetical protein